MMKTKAFAIISVALLLSALSSIPTGNAVIGVSNLWYETWHNYVLYGDHPQNISTTVSVQSPDGDLWIDVALVVSVYEYTQFLGDDTVNFKVTLYFDSFASEEIPVPVPVTASFVTFFIEKDSDGSNLYDQEIRIVDAPPTGWGEGYSQGYGLVQSTYTSSNYDGRAEWALNVLDFAVGLFAEPIDVAIDLISLANAWVPQDGPDYDNADFTEMQALSWWNNPGYDFGFQNPVRQYAFNSWQWLQNPDVNPTTYFGIKVSARVGLTFPNPIGYYIDTDPVYLRIYHYTSPPPPGGGGGCPFVYTWSGTEYVVDNNILGDSEASGGVDVEDYYRLEQPLARRDGKYSLLIREFEQEHSYLDQVRLLAVDHESDVHVAVTRSGEILTYKNPVTPISAVDNNGTSRLDEVSLMDGDVSDPATYFYGEPGDYVILDFGKLDISNGAKLVFRANIEKKPADPGECIHVQILDAEKGWVDIEVLRTRENWSTQIVDLSGYLPDANGELKVRLYSTALHWIDYVGLDTTKQDDFNVRYANLVSATHSEQGSVKTELSENDGIYAELVPNQQIELVFTLPENTNDTRTYIIYIKGHYYTITPENP